jgi:hypothetical protein
MIKSSTFGAVVNNHVRTGNASLSGTEDPDHPMANVLSNGIGEIMSRWHTPDLDLSSRKLEISLTESSDIGGCAISGSDLSTSGSWRIRGDASTVQEWELIYPSSDVAGPPGATYSLIDDSPDSNPPDWFVLNPGESWEGGIAEPAGSLPERLLPVGTGKQLFRVLVEEVPGTGDSTVSVSLVENGTKYTGIRSIQIKDGSGPAVYDCSFNALLLSNRDPLYPDYPSASSVGVKIENSLTSTGNVRVYAMEWVAETVAMETSVDTGWIPAGTKNDTPITDNRVFSDCRMFLDGDGVLSETSVPEWRLDLRDDNHGSQSIRTGGVAIGGAISGYWLTGWTHSIGSSTKLEKDKDKITVWAEGTGITTYALTVSLVARREDFLSNILPLIESMPRDTPIGVVLNQSLIGVGGGVNPPYSEDDISVFAGLYILADTTNDVRAPAGSIEPPVTFETTLKLESVI